MTHKLTKVDLAKIRLGHSQGISRKELAYAFDVSYGYIGTILGRKKRTTKEKREGVKTMLHVDPKPEPKPAPKPAPKP